MANFILLLHEHPEDYEAVSPADMQATVQRYQAWSRDLGAQNKIVRGDKLTDEPGRHLRLAGGKPLVTDGPYAEAAEIIGGLFIISAANYDEALTIAQGCPHLRGRNRIEVRQIDDLD